MATAVTPQTLYADRLESAIGTNYLAFVQLASIRLWLRLNESAS